MRSARCAKNCEIDTPIAFAMRSSVSTEGEARPRSTLESIERDTPARAANTPPDVPIADRSVLICSPSACVRSLRGCTSWVRGEVRRAGRRTTFAVGNGEATRERLMGGAPCQDGAGCTWTSQRQARQRVTTATRPGHGRSCHEQSPSSFERSGWRGNDFQLEATCLLDDQGIERTKKVAAYAMVGGKFCRSLLHESNPLRLHHRNVMMAFVKPDAAAAVEPLAQSFHQAPIDAVEFVAQCLQHDKSFGIFA